MALRSITRGWNVLPESVEEKIAAVAGDHQSGATHLAERSLRAFDLLVASGQLDRAAVQELSHRLEEGQPAMASIRHVVRLATKVLLENLDHWPGFREAMQRELEEGKREPWPAAHVEDAALEFRRSVDEGLVGIHKNVHEAHISDLLPVPIDCDRLSKGRGNREVGDPARILHPGLARPVDAGHPKHTRPQSAAVRVLRRELRRATHASLRLHQPVRGTPRQNV